LEEDVYVGLLARAFVLGFTIAAVVGPISLLVIGRTLAQGRVIGLASGLGVATADATYGAIAAFGLSALTGVLVDERRAIGLVGGVFLLWLAWRTLQPGPHAATTEHGLPLGHRAAYLSMLALTLANPMTILSFAALFAGLRVTGRDAIGSAFVTCGVFAGSGAWWLLLTSAVVAFRRRITPYWLRAINLVSGVAIGAFALAAILLAIRG
jgi:threonine/homoserine/homoserine lactone efflux protein